MSIDLSMSTWIVLLALASCEASNIQCYPIRANHTCVRYGVSSVRVPNFAGDKNIVAVRKTYAAWSKVLNKSEDIRECHPHIVDFLCFSIMPPCIENFTYPEALAPCRPYCEEVHRACDDVFSRHGIYQWPLDFRCNKFPLPGQGCFPLRLTSSAGNLNATQVIATQVRNQCAVCPRSPRNVSISAYYCISRTVLVGYLRVNQVLSIGPNVSIAIKYMGDYEKSLIEPLDNGNYSYLEVSGVCPCGKPDTKRNLNELYVVFVDIVLGRKIMSASMVLRLSNLSPRQKKEWNSIKSGHFNCNAKNDASNGVESKPNQREPKGNRSKRRNDTTEQPELTAY